jgi:hypothetical protein
MGKCGASENSNVITICPVFFVAILACILLSNSYFEDKTHDSSSAYYRCIPWDTNALVKNLHYIGNTGYLTTSGATVRTE